MAALRRDHRAPGRPAHGRGSRPPATSSTTGDAHEHPRNAADLLQGRSQLGPDRHRTTTTPIYDEDTGDNDLCGRGRQGAAFPLILAIRQRRVGRQLEFARHASGGFYDSAVSRRRPRYRGRERTIRSSRRRRISPACWSTSSRSAPCSSQLFFDSHAFRHRRRLPDFRSALHAGRGALHQLRPQLGQHDDRWCRIGRVADLVRQERRAARRRVRLQVAADARRRRSPPTMCSASRSVSTSIAPSITIIPTLRNGSPAARQVAAAAHRQAAGRRLPAEPARSLMVGVIGLWREGEPAHEPGDRVSRCPVGQSPSPRPAPLRVSAGSASHASTCLNSVPEIDNDPQKQNSSTIRRVVAGRPGHQRDHPPSAPSPMRSTSLPPTRRAPALAHRPACGRGAEGARTFSCVTRTQRRCSPTRRRCAPFRRPQTSTSTERRRRRRRPSRPTSAPVSEDGGASGQPSNKMSADGMAPVQNKPCKRRRTQTGVLSARGGGNDQA